MKKNKRKAFTLVELLAVIVILAVILVIAIPQIMNVIKSARMSSIKDSAMLIAEQAEKDYLSQQVLNKDYNSTSIPCSDVAKLNDDYASCKITYNNGIATVKLKGSNTGKFANLQCTGTKDNMECKEKETLTGYTDAVEYLTNLCDNTTGCNDASNTSGLIKTNGTELRYRGSNPNNYVTFNDEVAGWRIVGVFDGRVKLVRKDSLGIYSWDTSESNIANGYGISEWSQADLMRELNVEYLDTKLKSNPIWYSGQNNSKTIAFDINNVLKDETQDFIEDAVWYLGGCLTDELSTIDAYSNERGNDTCQSENTIGCINKYVYGGKIDGIERTLSWSGKVGLIYLSDFGYASSNIECVSNLSKCNNNWLGNYGWTITPSSAKSSASGVYRVYDTYISSILTYNSIPVHPSVYLIPDIQVKGTGTVGDPFIFVE